MPSAKDCEDIRRECRSSVYSAINRVDDKVDAKVSRWVIGIIITILSLVMSGAFGYMILRGNGKASAEDLKDAKSKIEATREEASETRATQRMILQGQAEMRRDLKEILDRLPK